MGHGEKSTLFAFVDPRTCDEEGDCCGGVSVESSGRAIEAPGVVVSFSWWPSSRKRRASSASLEMSLGGVGGLAGSDVKTEDDEPGEDMAARTRNSNKKQKSRRWKHVVRCEVGGRPDLYGRAEERESSSASRDAKRVDGWSSR